jgi:hypothetical protein
MISAWSINANVFDVVGIMLDGGLSLFFKILMIIMAVFIVFQALTYAQERAEMIIKNMTNEGKKGGYDR